ncbi:MAG: steroid-24-oyl-CoA synthetase [Actinomycetota bacterium]|nr:steroid-24-oyl-CoA synthetase [Actinomycetota bacterium]
MISVAEADRVLTAAGQPFEVIGSVIQGRPMRVWKNCPATLRDILMASRSFGDSAFLVYEDERVSFEDHFRACARLAHVLRGDFGVGQGDRVAIAMRNYPEWSLAFWAIAACGAVAVPLNAWWTGEELEYGLSDSGSTLVFADADRAERIQSRRKALPDLRTVVVARVDDHGGLPSGDVRLRTLLGPVPADVTLPDIELGPDDNATIFYTSGTTGRPKGALGTHRNICGNPVGLAYVAARTEYRIAAEALERGQTPPEPPLGRAATLLSVPFFHVTGCHSVLVANALNGGTLVMMHRWDPARALELIERERITGFGNVPAMVMQVLDHPDFATRDTSSVRFDSYGGAPAPPALVRRIVAAFPGSTPANGYGMTETSALSAMNAGPEYLAKPESVGPPVPVVDVKVVGPTGETLPTGEAGELWIYGPNVVQGYWGKVQETAATFSDGWVHTGDVARLDDERFVYIVDRTKDMLIRGGENIYCVEIEAVLFGHPAVADCAVIGIPHPTLGEEPGAVVQVRPGRGVTEAELQAEVAARLAAFKVPVRVWMVDQPLPRSAAGKIVKHQLRDELIGTAGLGANSAGNFS